MWHSELQLIVVTPSDTNLAMSAVLGYAMGAGLQSEACSGCSAASFTHFCTGMLYVIQCQKGVILLQEKGYVTADVAKEQNLHQLKLSGTKFRQLLRSGADIPDWFAFKSVVDVLREGTPSN